MRNDIAACARGWLGTRFHHQGRLKKTAIHKGGVDCLGLLIGVARELGLRTKDGSYLADFDNISYSHYPDIHTLRDTLSLLMLEIPYEGISVGDIVLLSIDEQPQHLAVVAQMDCELSLIHAYAPARAVVEHALDEWWQKKIAAVFRVI